MGNIGYFEIQVDNFQRAQKFYSAVFGWDIKRAENFPIEYYMIYSQDKGKMGLSLGGMLKRDKPLAENNGISAYVCHVLVENIDDAIAKITSSGGKLISDKQHIPAGWFAYALDTEGNTFGIWQMEQ